MMDRRTFLKRTGAISAASSIASMGLLAHTNAAEPVAKKPGRAKMRFGISSWVWVELIGKDDKALIERAKSLGFEGIEIEIFNRDDSNIPVVKETLARTGLTPIVSAALPSDSDLIDPDPAAQRRGLDFVRYCIDIAVRLGSELVVGPIHAAPGRKNLKLSTKDEQKQEFESSVRNLKVAAAYAADHGIRLAPEILNRYECRFANNAQAGVRLAEAVDHPAFGILLDTFHMNIEEKSAADAIRRAGKHLYHFQAIENDRGTPGSGSMDWVGMADALRDIEYQGWLCIEGFSRQVPWLAEAVCQWHPFAPDMDELARDGLEFLKTIMKARGAV